MAVTVSTLTLHGIAPEEVRVEVTMAPGLPAWHIVGLPDTAVKESIERIKSAIHHCKLKLPIRRVVVNLAPAEVHKHGTMFDLPIAVAVLLAAKCIPSETIEGSLFIGELSLDGTIKGIRGIIPLLLSAREKRLKKVYLPYENLPSAQLVPDLAMFGVRSLQELITHFENGNTLVPIRYVSRAEINPRMSAGKLAGIFGNPIAKRALQIAAVGHHHLLLSGPPGVGKTMLAHAITELLPPLTERELLEVNAIHSLHAALPNELSAVRPFQEVGSASTVYSLLGGGIPFRPGALSLAHNGILFLDEFAEFPRSVIEILRTPLESGSVAIHRARYRITVPAKFLLIAALNPCPCGYHGDGVQPCRCSPAEIFRYRKKISGPIMDRIDILLSVGRVEFDKAKNCDSEAENLILTTQNAHLFRSHRSGDHFSEQAISTLHEAANNLHVSMRVLVKMKRLARTIADIERSEEVKEVHALEALQYRKNPWQDT